MILILVAESSVKSAELRKPGNLKDTKLQDQNEFGKSIEAGLIKSKSKFATPIILSDGTPHIVWLAKGCKAARQFFQAGDCHGKWQNR
jgi:hypothetical protein